MDGRRRKYTAPGSEFNIPSRTRRYWKRRKLTEAINMHQSNQETQNLDQDSDPDSGSEDAHDGAEIHQNQNQNSSDNDSDSGSEDANDNEITLNLDQDSSEYNSDSGSENTHDGGEIHNEDSSDNRSEDAHEGDDITSLHTNPESDELPPNLSQTTESSVFSYEDSVDFGVFEPLWLSFTDSESIASGEEDSTDKSVTEESHLGAPINERFPPVNDEPLYTGSQLSKAQSFLLILSYALRHSLTGVALSDLLDLINIHCPENVLTSKYLFLKELNPIQGHLECHIYCPNCEYYIGDQVTEGSCSVCNSAWDRNSSLKNGNFFLYLPIHTQLEHLLQREDIACCLKSGNGTCNPETYDDICCGKMYHSLNKAGGPLDSPHAFSLTLNCDGVPVFKSSQYGIWPLQGMVNELPYLVRKENVLLFGLWFGTKKPNVNTFLKPFTQECQSLSTVGFKLHRNNSVNHCRVIAAVIMCDSVARPILQNMTQFNGHYGCSLCLHPGEQVPKGNGTVRVYPYKHVPKRDHASTLTDAREAVRTGQSVKGIKGPTCLVNIPHFDIISGMPPDHMHNVHLGVVRQMASMWLDSEHHEEPYYIGNRIPELDHQLLRIKPPCNITRVPRSFQQRKFWKASEWQNWLLFYSIFVLKGILPHAFYQHWLILVTFMFLLCKDTVTSEGLKRCEKLVVEFVKQFETLYGKENVSFNVHLCLHLPDSVRNWGPLWAHSGYIFESFNGEILKMFHGTQCVPLQIMKQFTYRQVLPLLKKNALTNAVPRCIQLYNNLTGEKKLKLFERVADQVVTLGLHYVRKLTKEEVLAMREKLSVTTDTVVKIFSRTLVKGELYYSEQFTRVMKRNSFTVLLDNGHIITVYYYIVVERLDNRKCFAVGKQYDKSHSFVFLDNVVSLKRVLQGRKQVFDVMKFNRKCMLVDLPQYANLYACVPPRFSVED
ncbi:uncharacterized protein LOC121189967 isoform X4 [Toxotes jaculatrix]|uniref:uncharacterized protein LOC121179738 isoform X4 n=1 Tax=Toxotes jaculatrix TaxID=941984 RepID=UPI001B3A8F7C|nr:uncharacterized protein LOC121179738 isoform X4 [Toxotes jaculatrix]XP_040896836.1 uncharacterized protein LOC121183713 isoform X4 [Toxotes jaculatrix]XP_040902446.1 uncharacterized protein LOC121187325 isoform X4 [Toxotes jaculatrix]XP_040902987.1 uncharacterized protein LOC121187686 isoform X4 [Toxotes jaculatrix]XP_040904580.1 uncharacterized protein LOC121188763 isoform X4 [Toxotes jaculatrix]XP_040906396.1 uncharacterized protein LOC121189967 isoform X4 [Toxotes jaculatrix]